MAVTTQGTAHLFGITGGTGIVANATVLSFSKTTAHANVATTQDEIGNTIEWRGDDKQVSATLTLRPRTLYTAPTVGDKLTFDSVDYVVESVAEDTQNAAFKSITLTLKGYEYITEA